MAEPVPPQKKPLVSVEFQTEINVATGAAERRMFVKMYFDARDSGLLAALGDRRWRTLCVLATYMDENGHCYPSQARMARDLGIHRQRVNERVQELLAFRFGGTPVIGLQPQPRIGGRWANNVYRIYPISGLQMFGGPSSPTEDEPTVSGFSDTVQVATVSGSTDTANPDTNQNQSINQKVVNALPDNDHKNSSERGSRRPPAISDRALRATYALTDQQIAQVHYLVEKQVTLLGAGVRNHSNYVKRAAEAVAAGDGQLLDLTLSDYKQAATTITVATPPAFFNTMWIEALQKRQSAPRSPAALPLASSPQPQGFERAGEVLRTNIGRLEAISESDDRIARMIADAERRGFPIPPHIRSGTNYQAVARWWAELADTDSGAGKAGAVRS